MQRYSTQYWSQPHSSQSHPRIAVILLNNKDFGWKIPRNVSAQLHQSSREIFCHMWSNAQVTICADGGANCLYDRAVRVEAESTFIPKYIKGDLDSLRPDVQSYYEQQGTEIIQDLDQDSNDLDKCLNLLYEKQQTKSAKRYAVFIFGGMGGRFDQEMQNINCLFRYHSKFQEMCLISEATTARLLLGGSHEIEPNLEFETGVCGIIPLGGMCRKLTTEGLQWDLNEQSSRFGELVSTSNFIKQKRVLIRNSDPVIWTTELRVTDTATESAATYPFI
uniref:Thiamin pyrophosphokinase putative n=1 Tax=Albugo laibachii Nc14 TaxID=890382 RepID=F0WTV0_9STRA|nr:thiamin pyrophosphokinase putative [Albugo laibachii Nc14]|eukprot:CCA24794.1 thiamin pyrophosphokinase putative [Albugo laibachii Nc14]